MERDSVIKVLVLEHRSIVSIGIAAALDSYQDLQVVAEAENEEAALRLCEQHHPDLVTIDIELPGEHSGIEVIRRLRLQYPEVRIVVLTNRLEEALLLDALRAGAIGYLLKDISVPELARVIRNAYVGQPILSSEAMRMLVHSMSAPDGPSLSAREAEVLRLIAEGFNNREIAGRLSISLSTVQFHVKKILAKLNVTNRTEATAYAIRHQMALNGRTRIH